MLQERGEQNYLRGASILLIASLLVKIASAIYKIPLFNIIDDVGIGTFQVTYNVFTLILTISTAGIPTALSRLVASANGSGNRTLVNRYFSVAMPSFILIGFIAMLGMFFFADNLAGFMNSPLAAYGIRVLSPAVFFACIISVYRGYAQGHENMVPTAISQLVEVTCKVIIGIAVALFLSRRNYPSHVVSAGAIVGVTIGLGLAVPLLAWYKRKMTRAIITKDSGSCETLPKSGSLFVRIMKVSIPITLTMAFMSINTVISNSIVIGRLQSALGMTDYEALAQYAVVARGMTVTNLPYALIVPIAISTVPAIAATIAKGNRKDAGTIMQSSLKIVNLVAMPAAAGIMALAAPILMTLYRYDLQIATTTLIILGATSFFVNLQYITTAILQANGFERTTLITFPIGVSINIALSFILSANPNIGILATPIGMLTCFIVISMLNISFIIAKVKNRPKFSNVFIRPLLCSAAMACASFGIFTLMSKLNFVSTLSEHISAGLNFSSALSEQVSTGLFLLISVIVGVIVYGFLIVISRTVTMVDMKLIPKGAKIAKLLKIKH